MSFIGSQGIVDTSRTPWWVNAPTQMLIMGHQSSGLVGFLFICPLNPSQTHSLFLFGQRRSSPGWGLVSRHFLGDPPPKPVESHGPEQRAGAYWYGMGRNIGLLLLCIYTQRKISIYYRTKSAILTNPLYRYNPNSQVTDIPLTGR